MKWRTWCIVTMALNFSHFSTLTLCQISTPCFKVVCQILEFHALISFEIVNLGLHTLRRWLAPVNFQHGMNIILTSSTYLCPGRASLCLVHLFRIQMVHCSCVYVDFTVSTFMFVELCWLIDVHRFYADIWPMLGQSLWIYKGLFNVWWTQRS